MGKECRPNTSFYLITLLKKTYGDWYDTSVLTDLDRGSLVEAIFRLPFAFTVPDLLYERELREHGGSEFVRLGLRVEELDGDGVSLALGYLRKRRTLFRTASPLLSRRPTGGCC